MAARITLTQVEDLFVQMRHQPALSGGGPLLWGYFFTDRDAAKLRPLAKFLESTGYRLVDINPTDGTTFFLHVEKVELHTPASLHERNTSFYGLAERFGIESYDGMDVGPAETAPKA
jgi:Regulator of ribonuclease activity B